MSDYEEENGDKKEYSFELSTVERDDMVRTMIFTMRDLQNDRLEAQRKKNFPLVKEIDRLVDLHNRMRRTLQGRMALGTQPRLKVMGGGKE